jgi:hypothetical protein
MIKNIIKLAIIIAIIVFVDWNYVLSKFQSASTGKPLLELNTLSCEVTQGEAHTSSLSRPKHVAASGTVTNISDEPLKLKASIEYRWQGKELKMSGDRTTSVSPSPLPPGARGTFSFIQYDVPDETVCHMSFMDSWTGNTIMHRGLKTSY